MANNIMIAHLNVWVRSAMFLFIAGAILFRLAWWWESVVRKSVIDDPLPTLLPFPPKLEGVFAPNTLLQGISKIGEGLLPGPEDLAFDAKTGLMYAACGDGWIKRITITHVLDGNYKVENWRYVGGRPLGIVMGNHGELLVCDPFQGLLNVTEDSVHVLSDDAGGKKFKFADGLDVSEDGSVYFTDATTKYGFGYSDYDVLEGKPNGRLLKYSPETKETTQLLTGLYFPNGVALSGDQTFLIFCETSKVRCSKYWLEGDKKGQIEVFIENLPGYPDNIRYNGHGIFWIGLVSKRSAMLEILFRIPQLKYYVAANKAVMEKLGAAALSMGRVIGVGEEEGEVVYMYEDPSGEAMPFVTTALQVDDSLYLGGLGTSYIGHLQLNLSLS